MLTKLTLKPGQNGTKHLTAEYGDRLVCVRYRYDPDTKRRIKTVELVVDESGPDEPRSKAVVAVRIGWHESELRERVKRAGARWNAQEKVWEIGYSRAIEHGLGDRIVESELQI